MKERLVALVGVSVRRPALTLGIVLALALGGALLALGLKPSAGTGTFVSSSSASYQATQKDHDLFGGDSIVILVREPLTDLVQSKDLATITFLEACLAGQYVVPSAQLQSFTPAPAGAHAPYGGWGSPCGKLMRERPVQVVYGPGTFLNQAVAAVNLGIRSVLASAQQQVAAAGDAAGKLALARGLSAQQAARAAAGARTLANQQETQQLAQLYLNSGINGTPRIDDPQFIPQIVFDPIRGVNQPKSRFSYLFPTANSALIQVRLRASLSDTQQAQAISWIRQAVAMPRFASAYGGIYTVSGEPVVVGDLASEISNSIAGLLVAAVLVMAATLLLVFRSRLRLLPLAVALAAAGITFGLLALAGGTLTMASIAVLPILIGLAVDYAIQFQSRVTEAQRTPGTEPGGGPDGAVRAVLRAAGSAGPTIALAALATAVGFLVLLLSPIPMVRGFGLLLVLGIAVAFGCAVAVVSAAVVLAGRDLGRFGPSLRGAGEILRTAGNRATARLRRPRTGGVPRTGLGLATRAQRAADSIVALMVRRPGRVLALGAALAVLGWGLDTQIGVQTDITKLVPGNMPALRNLHTLEHVTGVSGEIDVLVHGTNVATPAVVSWMLSYEQGLQHHFGYLETKGCASSNLCPALSLPDLFSSGTATSAGSSAGGSSAGGSPAGGSQAGGLSQGQIDTLLKAVPTYFSQAVITADRHYATLAFGIRLMPLARQQQVIDFMRSQLHPPAGIDAQLTGLPVLAAQANGALSSSARRLLTLVVSLIAVALVLLAVLRRPRRALIPLIPIAMATGWSALILFLIGIPLNPMSATLGTLVIAISTEFSVLLSERFAQERGEGYDLPTSLARTLRSTGVAALASGVTAVAGFGVLISSQITMLRDFGFVTVVDLTVSLTGVLVVLPAVLAANEQEGFLRSFGARVRGAAAQAPRLRRRARVA